MNTCSREGGRFDTLVSLAVSWSGTAAELFGLQIVWSLIYRRSTKLLSEF